MSALAEALVAAQAELPCALGKEARYAETDTDAETERRADHRWGLGASESPAEGTEA